MLDFYWDSTAQNAFHAGSAEGHFTSLLVSLLISQVGCKHAGWVMDYIGHMCEDWCRADFPGSIAITLLLCFHPDDLSWLLTHITFPPDFNLACPVSHGRQEKGLQSKADIAMMALPSFLFPGVFFSTFQLGIEQYVTQPLCQAVLGGAGWCDSVEDLVPFLRGSETCEDLRPWAELCS